MNEEHPSGAGAVVLLVKPQRFWRFRRRHFVIAGPWVVETISRDYREGTRIELRDVLSALNAYTYP